MMTIEPFTVRLDSPLETARGTIQEREGFLVSVSYEGVYGVGEATPLPGWTESYEECREALDRAATVADELDWGIALAKTESPAARHGLSLAFAEARARNDELPLYRSIGGSQDVDLVPVNATLGARGTPAEMAQKARKRIEAGFDCLKLKVGTNGLEEDLERVRAVRNAVGDDIEIRVDANGAWTFETARRAIDALGELDVSYVEQPLPSGELDSHAQLRGGAVDVALDESLTASDVESIIAADAADVLVLKPMVLGGPDRAVAAARQCQAAGIDPIVSTSVDAVVARTGAVHVAASIPDIRPCGLATADMLATDLGPDSAPVVDGHIQVPQDSGLGLSERPT
jgi:o-succinylbenzoate synthase